MAGAKDIIVKVIPSNIANDFVRKYHYSGKVVNNSRLHFGAFLSGKLHGVMSFGNSMDKRKTMRLVEGTGWNEFIELNRMAFDDVLPKNSESRCIAIAIRLIKKNAPHIKWIISFADGAQCGDGTIYRASGFYLTGIRENKSIYLFPSGNRICQLVLTADWNTPQVRAEEDYLGIPHKYRPMSEWVKLGAKPIDGYQLRYVYFIDKTCKDKLTVPILPFSTIEEMGAGMYKGERR